MLITLDGEEPEEEPAPPSATTPAPMFEQKSKGSDEARVAPLTDVRIASASFCTIPATTNKTLILTHKTRACGTNQQDVEMRKERKRPAESQEPVNDIGMRDDVDLSLIHI